MSERVLVLPRDAVPGGCDFRGIRPADDRELEALRAALRHRGRLLAREVAEHDPAFKQVIPYVVVRDGERLFLMRRTTAGGDDRLHHRYSVGVGGHLNDGDALPGGDPLVAGLEREWREELDADWTPEFRLVGLLNDDSNAVGAVHLGVVFQVDARGRPAAVREHAKLAGEMVEPSRVREVWDQLETWSQLVADHLLSVGRPTGQALAGPG